jgi:ribulose-phosphate 3-epimerase
MKISPSILNADFSNIGKIASDLEAAGADSLHLDVMDGHFVKNITFGPVVIKAVRKATRLPLETHLMIENPDLYINQFIEAGSDAIIIHREAHCNTLDTINKIKARGIKAGLALNPETGLKSAEEFLPSLDMLLIMAVSPGFGGQAFINECCLKINEARRYFDQNNLKVEIGVDGGINMETAKLAKDAGADKLVAGTSIINSDDMHSAISGLRNI